MPDGHTAGDWKVEAVSDAVRVVVGEGRKKVILARLAPPQIPENETQANAELMAASPKLKEALEAILRVHHNCNEGESGMARYKMAEAADKALKELERMGHFTSAGKCKRPGCHCT